MANSGNNSYRLGRSTLHQGIITSEKRTSSSSWPVTSKYKIRILTCIGPLERMQTPPLTSKYHFTWLPHMGCAHRNADMASSLFVNTSGDENGSKVSLLVRVKITRQRPQVAALKREESWSDKSNHRPSTPLYQPSALPLGQTRSQRHDRISG